MLRSLLSPNVFGILLRQKKAVLIKFGTICKKYTGNQIVKNFFLFPISMMELFSIFFVAKHIPHPVGNLNTCTEVNICLFLFMPALEIACRQTKVLITVGSA